MISALVAQVIDFTKYVELGALGGICGALVWLVRWVLASHREERTEWREASEKQIDRLNASEDKRCERTENAFEKLSDAIREGRK